MNSRSRSLYVVVRPSVCTLVCQSVDRLSSVTFVHPTQASEILGNVSMPFGTCDLSIKFYRDRPMRNPPPRGGGS